MNINLYIEYDTNGLIISHIQGIEEVVVPLREQGKQLILVDREYPYEDYYVKNEQVLERPNQQTKFTGLMLTDLPNPCTVTINGTPYECNSEVVELEFDQPTTYTILVQAWPHKDWETTYENKA